MCTPIVIQYRDLQNLLAEIKTDSRMYLHVLEQTRTTTSDALALKEIKVSVNVRVIQGSNILSWHYVIDEIETFMTKGATGSAYEQYDQAWDKANKLLSALSLELSKINLNLKLDGIVELPVRALVSGKQNLVSIDSFEHHDSAQALTFAA